MFIFHARQQVGAAVGIQIGLVNQKLLLENEHLAAENRHICLPVCAFPIQSARLWLRSASRRFGRS
jgi:hypothetical protein